MAAAHPVMKVLTSAFEFVEAKNGCWNHDEWEAFCKDAHDSGIQLFPENEAALGAILENVRQLYLATPAAPMPKKCAAPKKAAPRKKKAE